jgi:peroxiredoxin
VEEASDLGASFMAVAVTATYSQMAFAERLGVDFPLLSDWNRDVCAQYGVQYKAWKGHAGVAKRAVFVLDQTGTVRLRWVADDASEMPDLDAVLGTLRELCAPEPLP